MPESRSVLAARSQFLQRGTIADELIPRTILRSWTRCAGLGLHMTARPSVEPVTAKMLQEVREQHDLLRRGCRSELEALHAEAKATDSIVILTDASGMVLERLGSMEFADRAARVALSPVFRGVNPQPEPTPSAPPLRSADRSRCAAASTISSCTAS